MANNPQVLELLEEMLNSGKTPEEVCRDCVELLPEVRRRWQQFQVIDAQLRTLVPGLDPAPQAGTTAPPQSVSVAAAVPAFVGRYRVERLLGEGGFGRVYLAHDEQLQRAVAIKVAHAPMVAQAGDAEAYLAEARTVASLDHPNIVPVFDVGNSETFRCYVVSKFIDGSNLTAKVQASPLSLEACAGLVATVAEALHHAHKQGIVHRDIKPGNLLLDRSGKPFVADFGLALREPDIGKGPRHAGTPNYMSPEQARGEGHRVDGRSDVFSLGVVFYELLTGRRPFRGTTRNELVEQITSVEARPPRQWDDTIPKELERICLKALSKRASERYPTARDMADDLRHFLAGASTDEKFTITGQRKDAGAASPLPSPVPTPSDQQAIKVVPKGLRSFDAGDADFFLELLPGPRDRDGLSESIRFWKTRIEAKGPDSTFSVGLLYGPSGCGKSSLMKAGLLPRLARRVTAVYVEATGEETESRLLKGLRRLVANLPVDSGLVETLAALRQGQFLGPDQKVLLVLDQFEQWLHARRAEENTQLVQALRQCDGERLQCIVLVRDDFWLAISRFLQALEIRVVEGENSRLVDLFDPLHARKVLAAFGRAHGRLPDNLRQCTKEQRSFLDQAIGGLAEDGKVISVRLALFAEMVKGKPWTPATLKEVGGTEGVGVTFLEETFAASTAPPQHRLHQRAAQAVLKALLPELGTDIKGHMRSEETLRAASGHGSRPDDFADLLRILDGELRLITPTELEGRDHQGEPAGVRSRSSDARCYQLTHDYLVPSLREWLTRRQKKTRRGRAELLLSDRAAVWNAHPENRQLPSLWEWAKIRAFTGRCNWTEPERKLMRRAGPVLGLRSLAALLLLGLLSWGGIQSYGTLQGSYLVESLRTAAIADVPAIVEKLDGYRRWANPHLKALVQSLDDRQRLHASLALLPADPSQLPYLEERLLAATPSELPVIRDALKPHQAALIPKLWSLLDAAQPGDAVLVPAASALAAYDPTSPRWVGLGGKVAQALVGVYVVDLGVWLEAFRPIGGTLKAPLAVVYRDRARPETERTVATDILVDYARDDPAFVAGLLMDADPRAYAAYFALVERHAAAAVPVLQAKLKEKPDPQALETEPEPVKDVLAAQQARAAIALFRMGHVNDVIPLLPHSPDPRLRSFIVQWLNPLGADPAVLAALLARIPVAALPTPAQDQKVMDAILFDAGTSQRRALILVLGTYGTAGLSEGDRRPLIAALLDLYRDDPDSGIHEAAAWTLRQWGQQEKLQEADAKLITLTDWGDRRWIVNSQGQTFAVIQGPVTFAMGSPPTEPDHQTNEELHPKTIPHRFAIATREVTVGQYAAFAEKYPEFAVPEQRLEQHTVVPDGPMIGCSWYGAAAYCNWLSEREGLPQNQWCYEPNAEGEYDVGMRIKAEVLALRGYRLPTEREWEYACRAGTVTSRPYGESLELLGHHAWFQGNSRGNRGSRCGVLRPNDLGLFDVLGNAFEWCQDAYGDLSSDPNTSTQELVTMTTPRLLRGGAFDTRQAYVRSAARYGPLPSDRSVNIGFRPTRTYR